MSKIYQTGDVVLHNWIIEKPIGEGSYGKVYQIGRDDFGTHYSAALKIISVPQNEAERRAIVEEGLTDQEVTQYFYTMVEEIVKEFAIMSQFKGTTNIVSYEDHQVVEHKDGNGWDIFIRMELLTPLHSHLTSKPMSLTDVAHLAVDMCHALELCQKYNVIHRDIKPENIFVSQNGAFKLGDFGIARTIERTSSGLSKKGTYSYMAPEVYRGLEYGFTVDTYSLGLVLYRLLNQNRLPFLPTPPAPLSFSDREQALATRIGGSSLPLPCYGTGGIAEIVCKACSYDPDYRYSSAHSLRMAVEALGELSQEILNMSSVTPQDRPRTGDSVPRQREEILTPASEGTERTTGMFSPQPERTERTTGIFSTEQENFSQQPTSTTGEVKKSPWFLALSLVAVVALAVGLGFFVGTQGDRNGTDTETVLPETSEQNDSSDTETVPTEVPEETEQMGSSVEDTITIVEGKVLGTSGGVNIRDLDAFGGSVLYRESNGGIVEVLSDVEDSWYEVRFTGSDGTGIGYVPSRFIVLTSEEEDTPSVDESMTELENQIANAEKDGFLLEVIENEIVLVMYTGIATDVEIPELVTRIGDMAFLDSNVETVTMGNSVKSMGRKAFQDCASLRTVTLSDAITTIEDLAFGRCFKLEKITGSAVTHIGELAFSYCDNLDLSFMTNSLIYIGEAAFSSCKNVTNFEIPSSVEFIGDRAFAYCFHDNLYSVTIANPNVALGEEVFVYCENLNTVYLWENSTAEAYFQENHPNVSIEYL